MLYKKTFFGTIIQSVSLSYFKTVLTTGFQLIYWTNGLPVQTEQLKKALAICLVAFLLPLLILAKIMHVRGELELPHILERYGKLYSHISALRAKSLISVYYPLFLTRRNLFVLVGVLLVLLPYIKLLAFMVTTIGYMAFFIGQASYIDRTMWKLEAFNEVMLVLVCYHY